MEHHFKPNDKIRKIWWIASYPKSGNTWVRMFLEAYATGLQVDLNASYGRFVVSDNATYFYQAVCPWPVTTVDKSMWALLRTPAILQIIASRGSIELALKTHHANIRIDDCVLIPPLLTKGAVYLIRDPRDVVISWASHSSKTIDEAIDFMSNDASAIFDKYSGMGHYIQGWSAHVRSWTTGNETIANVAVVRYEDLIHNAKLVFQSILSTMEFNGIHEERLEFALKESSFSSLQSKENSVKFVEQEGKDKFFRVGKTGQWKDILTTDQVKKIEDHHGEMMTKFDYKCIV